MELNKLLRKAKKSKKIYEILEFYGPFDGGCLVVSRALMILLPGAQLVRLVSKKHDGMVTEHYGVEFNSQYIDFYGVNKSANEWIERFQSKEHIQLPLTMVKGKDLMSDIDDNIPKARAVAQHLKELQSEL